MSGAEQAEARVKVMEPSATKHAAAVEAAALAFNQVAKPLLFPG